MHPNRDNVYITPPTVPSISASITHQAHANVNCCGVHLLSAPQNNSVYGQLTRLSPRCVRVWLCETTSTACLDITKYRLLLPVSKRGCIGRLSHTGRYLLNIACYFRLGYHYHRLPADSLVTDSNCPVYVLNTVASSALDILQNIIKQLWKTSLCKELDKGMNAIYMKLITIPALLTSAWNLHS